MNITEFAERIVFGTTMEEKLKRPGRLTNDSNRDSKALSTNALSRITPGRPYGLTMQTGRSGAQPPSDDQLENERSRGQLLHFLANHELLATELMALVLLKFPDAPSAFRRGVLVTLQEEQAHTQMYLDRMAACGVEFGSYPVSGQFWRLIEPMESPMDFVARLSLTFEQANLDYSLHFASVFERIGDHDTAAILQKIYTDEISHVQHGLQWFRQWKDPQQSDWEAYVGALDFPMSPQRGRGPRAAFNRGGRTEAGLTDDFIDSIEVYRQSRGRPPNVFWFDAATEIALEGHQTPRDKHLIDQLRRDLELVMVAVAKEDDIVLTSELPPLMWRKKIVDAGMELPQFLTFDQSHELANRKLGSLSPWSWTPENHRIAAAIACSVQTAPPQWQANQEDLFRKSFATQKLAHWLKEDDLPAYFTDRSVIGRVATDEAGVFEAIRAVERSGYGAALIKEDLSASGRNQFRIACNQAFGSSALKWIKTRVARGKRLVVEPQLDRVVDLSFLWRWDSGCPAPTFIGWTRPIVTLNGRYSGTRFGNVFGDCEPELKRFLLADRAEKIQAVAQWLTLRLTDALEERKFVGFFGVDALVCRTGGNYKIKPLVELNPRMTMGHIALKLSKNVATGVPSEFRIFNRDQWATVEARLDAIEIKTAGDGRWKSAVINLSSPNDQSRLFPAMIVGKTAITAARMQPNSHRSTAHGA